MSSILNVLTKWRQVYTMMATMGDMVAFERYLRDTAEKNLLYRVELSAIAALMIQKKIITPTELTAQCEVEAEHLMKLLEQKFPGFSATDTGMTMTNPEALKTMEGWRKPYGLGEGN